MHTTYVIFGKKIREQLTHIWQYRRYLGNAKRIIRFSAAYHGKNNYFGSHCKAAPQVNSNNLNRLIRQE